MNRKTTSATAQTAFDSSAYIDFSTIVETPAKLPENTTDIPYISAYQEFYY